MLVEWGWADRPMRVRWPTGRQDRLNGMPNVLRCLAAFLSLLAASACMRYVERTRPLTAADCPEETQRSTLVVGNDPGRRGSIAGRIFDADDPQHAPLSHAFVRLEASRSEAATDSLGRFRLDSLGPGRYAIWIRRLGLVARRDTIDLVADAGATLEIGLERQPLDGCPGFGALVERKRVWRWPWQ